MKLTRISKIPNSKIKESEVDMDRTLTLLARHNNMDEDTVRKVLEQGKPLETPFARYIIAQNP